MPTILDLHNFAIETSNSNACNVTLFYLTELDTFGTYLLGGVIECFSDNDINLATILVAKQKIKKYSSFLTNDVDYMKCQLQLVRINFLNDLLELRRIRYSGILKVVCRWLSSSRKKAAEIVFHPSNMTPKIINNF